MSHKKWETTPLKHAMKFGLILDHLDFSRKSDVEARACLLSTGPISNSDTVWSHNPLAVTMFWSQKGSHAETTGLE